MASFGLFGSAAPRIRRLTHATGFAPTIEELQAQQAAQLQQAQSTDTASRGPSTRFRMGAFGQGPTAQPSPDTRGVPAGPVDPKKAIPVGNGPSGYTPGKRDWWGEISSDPLGFLLTGTNGLSAKRDEGIMSDYARQAAEATAKRDAEIQQLIGSSNPQDRMRLAYLMGDSELGKQMATNFAAANIDGGNSRLVDGKLVTAPKLGMDGGYGYTQTPDGTTWDDRRGMSYGEETDAATLAETGRHNKASEAIDRETNDITRKKNETDALVSQLPNFGNENQLRTQYLGQAKTFETVKDAYTRIQAVGNARNPAEQMSLIFGYMKMLDPGSTVREGEYATAQNTTGLPGWVTNAYNKAKDGVFLNEQQVQDFLNQSKAQYRAAATNYSSVLDQYRDLAGRYRMDPTIIQDFRLKEAPQPNIAQSAIQGIGNVVKGVGGAFGNFAQTQQPVRPDDVSDLLDKYK